LTIPAGVTSIGDWAFYNCGGLTGTLTIPAGVTSIGDYAFAGCSGFTGPLTIPAGVTSIGNSAFAGCSGLTSLTIPGSVTSIGEQAFYNCSGLTSVIFVAESNIATPWNNNSFTDSSYSSTGDSLWTAYTGGASKAGTYTLSGSTWTQTQ
jgi:hypothetical protein